MNANGLLQELYTAFMAGMLIAAPPMIAAAVVGVLLAIIQAAVQIQDQSLPQLVKIIVILVVLVAFGVPLSTPLFEHTRQLFAAFHVMTR